MRKIFSEAIERLAVRDEKIIFLTGDLGFNAFENLQASLGSRFINMGVAEQNMIGAAAGMASEGYKVFCYSIAPFIVYRCLEQFRNDVCFHNLPVFLVGNGGGYGYGIMGSSHHALEDLACLASMPAAKCHIPAFDDDVPGILNRMINEKVPAYLRLGLSKRNSYLSEPAGSFTKHLVCENPKATIVALGPLVNNVLDAISQIGEEENFDVFTLQSLPLEFAQPVIDSIERSRKLIVAEEHSASGGIGEKIAMDLFRRNIIPGKFISVSAKGYPGNKFGSQEFHQRQSGLDVESLARLLAEE